MKETTTSERYVPCRNGEKAYVGDTVYVTYINGNGTTNSVSGVIYSIPDDPYTFILSSICKGYLCFNPDNVTHVEFVDRTSELIPTAPTEEDYKQQLADAKAKAEELQKKIETFERYKQYEEMADELAAMKNAYIQAGFSKEEAFQLLTETMKAAATMVKKR